MKYKKRTELYLSDILSGCPLPVTEKCEFAHINAILGCKSRWLARCMHMCSRFCLIELVNLIWLRDASVNGMVNLTMDVEEVWKKGICERIQEVGREVWKDGFKNTERGNNM